MNDYSSLKGKHVLCTQLCYLAGIDREKAAGLNIETDEPSWTAMENTAAARVIHNLSGVRSELYTQWDRVCNCCANKMPLYSFSNQTRLKALSRDANKINISGHLTPEGHISRINSEIQNRIPHCKRLVSEPYWGQIKTAVIQKNGTVLTVIRQTAEAMKTSPWKEVFGAYVNIQTEDPQKALVDDYHLLCAIDHIELGNTDNYSNDAQRCLNEFLSIAKRAALIVDCENADPYKLCAAIWHIDDKLRNKLTRVILIFDEHASTAWRKFGENLPAGMSCELREAKRLLPDKSLVDQFVAAAISEERYSNRHDAIILASSDSDMWGALQGHISAVNFLVLLERSQSSPLLTKTFDDNKIRYCWVDNVTSPKARVLWASELTSCYQNSLPAFLSVTVDDVLDTAMTKARINLPQDTRNKALEYLKENLCLEIDKGGHFLIALDKKKAGVALSSLWKGY